MEIHVQKIIDELGESKENIIQFDNEEYARIYIINNWNNIVTKLYNEFL